MARETLGVEGAAGPSKSRSGSLSGLDSDIDSDRDLDLGAE